ncbi:MAG: ABC transporter substrate-binding protein [Xenococcaceae cyanobacterium MO_188.B19]|nr:ABC transporter substrate-binding protein [Xenococcaceae cyanobacterium MO_188.B19]
MWKKSHRSRKPWFLYCAVAFFTFTVTVSCSQNQQSNQSPIQKSHTGLNQTELNIWWEKGFNLREDEAFRTIIDDWERATGNKVKVSFYPTNELSEKVARTVRSGNFPDLIMSQKANPTLYPRLAWDNKLEDVSDVIEPVKDSYPEHILKAVTYSNGVTGQSSYYGIPVHQATIFIFYWQKLLSLVGLSSEDIPQDWDSFWQFWQQAQFKLANQQNKDIYGLGLPFSVNGSDDLYLLFEHILEAYDVRLIDETGNLLIDQPQVRQRIIKCLDWYSQFYLQGFVPPDSINWLNIDNNRNLLNRVVLMTPNVTLSIPGAVREDQETYYKRLGIVGFPNKPNGQPMRYIITVKQAVIFADSPHVKLAKDFMRYFIQPEVTIKYLQASGNRNQPVQNSVWQDPFWQQTTDPYLKMTTKILATEKSRLSYTSNNPAYSQVLEENIWGKTLNRIVVDRLSPEQAADEAIAKIKKIFNQWENNE